MATPRRPGGFRPGGDDRKGLRELLLHDHRNRYERAVLVLLALGGLLSLGGSGVMIGIQDEYQHYAAWAVSTGALLLTLTLIAAHPIRTMRTIGLETTGGEQYDRMRRWARMKFLSILLNLLVILGGVILGVALLSRLDVIALDTAVPSTTAVVSILVMVMTGVFSYTLYMGLRTPLERTPNAITDAFLFLGLLASALFSAMIGVISTAGSDDPAHALRTADVPFYMLAAFVTIGASSFWSRSLPTIYSLFVEEREFYAGRAYASRKKSVVIPGLLAFGLLFLVIFVAFVFQLGVAGLVQEVPRNTVLLGLFVFIALMLGVTVIASVILSRSEDKTPLYQVKRTAQAKQEIALISVSGSLTLIALAAAGLLFSETGIPGMDIPTRHWLDFFTIGVLFAVGPYGFYHARKEKRTRDLEERFPDLLRDIAASRKAGLTLENSVLIASKGEYGALTPEIQKMADQLSWNIPFSEALERFAERVSTPLILRAVSLINQASKSGGHVTDVLMAAATDARELKQLENERRGTMLMYTIVIYIAFLVFLGVVAVLYGTFIPEIVRTTQAVSAAGGGVGSLGFSDLTLDDYRTFYFLAAVFQAVGNGIVAGMMESGKGLNGLRHSFTMVAISYAVFGLLVG